MAANERERNAMAEAAAGELEDVRAAVTEQEKQAGARQVAAVEQRLASTKEEKKVFDV